MLKKFMIICLAFSFVFIGGIAFAADEEPVAPVAPQEGQTISPESADSSGDITPPADPTDLIADEVKDEVDEAKDNVLELKDKIMEEGDNGHN